MFYIQTYSGVHGQYTYTILQQYSTDLPSQSYCIHHDTHSLDLQYVQSVPISRHQHIYCIHKDQHLLQFMVASRRRPKITDRVKVTELQPWRSVESRLWQTSRCPSSSSDRVIQWYMCDVLLRSGTFPSCGDVPKPFSKQWINVFNLHLKKIWKNINFNLDYRKAIYFHPFTIW